MSEQTPEHPEGDDDGGVIDTSQHVEKDEAEPDTFEPDVPKRDT